MFWKKILFLTAWYIAWSVVGSLYKSKKKMPSQLKSKKDAKQLTESFLEIQKNFIDDIEKRFLSENGKEKLQTTKKKFHEYADRYLEEGEKILAEIQVSEKYQETKTRWLSFFENLTSKAQSLYNKALAEEDKLKTSAKDTLEDGVSRVKRAKDELTKKK